MKKAVFPTIVVLLCTLFSSLYGQKITRIAGGYSGDGGPASSAPIFTSKIAFNKLNGKLCFYNALSHTIQYIEDGKLYNYFGMRSYSDSTFKKIDITLDSDHFPINTVYDLSFDDLGTLYYIDGISGAIVKKTLDGKISYLGGGKNNVPLVTPLPDTSINLGYADCIAIDRQKNIYFPTYLRQAIYKIDGSGMVQRMSMEATYCGVPSSGYHNIPVKNACLHAPSNFACDGINGLWGVCDSKLIFNVSSRNLVNTFNLDSINPSHHSINAVVGDTLSGCYFSVDKSIYHLDTTGLISLINTFDSADTTYTKIQDFHVINKDSIYYLLGNGNKIELHIYGAHSGSKMLNSGENSYCQSNGWNCTKTIFKGHSNLYPSLFVDITNKIFSGWNNKDSSLNFCEIFDSSGIVSSFNTPKFRKIAQDSKGNYYLLAPGAVYRTDFKTKVEKIAGDSTTRLILDGLPATACAISDFCDGIVVNKNNEILFIDHSRIRIIDTNGIMNTIAGNGRLFNDGDEGMAKNATILGFGLTIDKDSALYFFTDESESKIRKIDSRGVIHTIAGGGSYPFDGYAGTDCNLGVVSDLVCDSLGRVCFIQDHQRVRMLDTNGLIVTLAGGGNVPFCENTMNGKDLRVGKLGNLSINQSGEIYFFDLQSGVYYKTSSVYHYPDVDIPQTDTSFALQVYPNPTNGNLHVKYYTLTPGPVQMVIIDVAGRRLETLETSTTTGIIDETIELPRGMQSGMYFLKLTTPTGGNGRKFMLQH